MEHSGIIRNQSLYTTPADKNFVNKKPRQTLPVKAPLTKKKRQKPLRMKPPATPPPRTKCPTKSLPDKTSDKIPKDKLTHPPKKYKKNKKKQHEPHRKNSLRRYTILPLRKSACEMFANLRIPLFEIL